MSLYRVIVDDCTIALVEMQKNLHPNERDHLRQAIGADRGIHDKFLRFVPLRGKADPQYEIYTMAIVNKYNK